MKGKIQLSDHFTYRRLIRFVLPSIGMMIFTSIYGVVDGLFVSNYAGKSAFAAVNLIMPFPMLLGALGFMLGTGGSAVVARALGEGEEKKANAYFSMLVYVTLFIGLVLTLLGQLFLPAVAKLFGAEGDMLTYCIVYGRILFCGMIPFMLQNVFQSFLVVAEKPGFGLVITVAAGVTNIVLDYVFVGVMAGGIQGAGYATVISQIVGGIIPFVFFCRKNGSPLYLTRTKLYGKVLVKTCLNGSSELMTNVSMSLVSILYNYQLISLAGEDGVAAYGVIMYVNFIFISTYVGYSIGSAPIISFHYGAGNKQELQNVYRKSLTLMGGSGILMTVSAIALSGILSQIFVGYDVALMELTKRGFVIYSLSFLIMGINVYGSAFFTALGNGLVSALISFLRTLLFQVAAVLMLPVWLGIDGIWLAIVVSEVLALFVTAYFFIKEKSRYGYW